MDGKKNHDNTFFAVTGFFGILLFVLIIGVAAMIGYKYYDQNYRKTSDTSDTKKTEKVSNDNEASPDQVQAPSEAEKTVAGMTLEEKVAQMFMVEPEEITGVGTAVQAGEKTKEALAKYPVGGIIYFSKNLVSPDQIKEMITNTKAGCKYVPFIGIDEEGGSEVARVANNDAFSVTRYPDMSEVGKSGDTSEALSIGQGIGTYLAELGFNMDFAPVADVLVNADSPILQNRSFGSDPEIVSEMTAALVQGLQEKGVSSVLKHFPGHGATDEDSHEATAVSGRSLEQLKETEFRPFESGIKAGADFVMVGHIAVPEVTGDNTPATLSYQVVTELLRNQLGFQKVVITDSMKMGAVTGSYNSKDAAVTAIQAGVDMILMPESFTEAYEGVLEAVHSGVITESRIDESVVRIMEVKMK